MDARVTDHCPACTVARELRGHRDATATEWSCRRAMLNFAAIVADRACVGYVPAGENPALNKGIEVESGAQSGPDAVLVTPAGPTDQTPKGVIG